MAIRCEGTGQPVNCVDWTLAICDVCKQLVEYDPREGKICPHMRENEAAPA